MSETPIRVTVGPGTRGGKSIVKIFGGMNERPISSKAHNDEVPKIAP